MKHPKLSHAFEVVAELPEPIRGLRRLAENYRWTWHHETRDLFRAIDRDRWEAAEHNPVRLLTETPPDRLAKLGSDTLFLERLRRCEKSLDEYLAGDTWFDRAYPGARNSTSIAYFCAEFGISESLPIYSGGLGVLAGDHLKAASDLGLPLAAVGLLYARGYFRQRLNPDGWQQEVYPQYDFFQMPLKLMRREDGHPIRVEVEFPDRTVTCQIWKAEVGRIPLYLLDSNVLENEPTDQGITDTLYGGDEEMRLRQEMILGIGGMRALRALGIHPTVCHMNEGHAAFLSLERIRGFMKDRSTDFKTARQAIAGGNVFTTHTPVPAGFDVFHGEMLEKYVGRSVGDAGLKFSDLLRLGRLDPENEGEAFNMAVFAMETSNHVNGVSQLHASVTRSLFGARWPDFAADDVPVEAVTNGIHTQTWISSRFASMYDEHLGPRWRTQPEDPAAWAGVESIPDDEVWAAIEGQRSDFVRFARTRLQRDLERRLASPLDLGGVLDPDVLTVGFARRFATYKRAALMLTDKERLLKLLFHPDRPIQIVVAGKSHPRDDGGKQLIQQLVHFIEQEGGRARMVFLEDYDMRVARAMVQGVDVWLNNPRRPMEASGTSGMKVVPNGGLNCSVLDGWWDEAYEPGLGWAIGDRTEWADGAHQDWLDSRALYSLLEHEIAPKFYSRNDRGIPSEWLRMVKLSIQRLAPRFSTSRMVTEYASRFYMPASECYAKFSAEGLGRAAEALAYKEKVRQAWPAVTIQNVSDTNGAPHSVGSQLCVRAAVMLGSLSAEEVKVQVVVGKIGPNRDLHETHAYGMRPAGQADGAVLYEATIPCDSPGYLGYTIRVMPEHPDLFTEHELRLVRWEQS